METLHDILLPYKEVVGQVASIVTIGQFFSGSFICYDVYKQKSTKGINAMPFIGGITIGLLMLKYGFLLKDDAVFTVNVSAITLNIVYLSFYLLYSESTWNEIGKPMSYGILLVAICLGYAEIEAPDLVEYRYGLLVTILMLLLIGSPLLDIGRIISSKDASAIPFPMTLMGTVVSFLWLLYGIILNNSFMVVQNIIGLILCKVQLILIFMYGKLSGTDGKTRRQIKTD